jgi:hypothetical protein
MLTFLTPVLSIWDIRLSSLTAIQLKTVARLPARLDGRCDRAWDRAHQHVAAAFIQHVVGSRRLQQGRIVMPSVEPEMLLTGQCAFTKFMRCILDLSK